jgi:GNAT superfamily N-acetyltransferase
MDIVYRPANSADLDSAARVVQLAYNSLREHHGLAPTIPLRPPLFQALCLAKDPEGLWVAEAGQDIVGFGFSWMCQKFWFLAQLFIKPDTQARGVGQTLLSKTLRQAQRHGAENRALITTAYNLVSAALYLRNGMYPRELLYRMAAPATVVRQHLATGGIDTVPIASWPAPREWIGGIDEQILGFRRDAHHQFLLGGFAARALRIEQAGRPVGYAYISADGHLGPIAVAPDADATAVVAAALRCALDRQPEQVSMIVPGRAEDVLALVSRLGFRIDEPYVVMSASPFGDWRRYLPSNPGYM